MGERGDILRTIHKVLQGQQRESVLETEPTSPVIGRIAAKGLADELNDRGYLVVDGIDGGVAHRRCDPGQGREDRDSCAIPWLPYNLIRSRQTETDRTDPQDVARGGQQG